MEPIEDIVELISRDHAPLKKSIDILKDSNTFRADKEAPFESFVPLLIAHAKAEEKSLYVKVKENVELRMGALEGDAEHVLAEQLIQKINATPDDDNWNAKVKLLAELVEHHIEKEEDVMLLDVEEKISLATRTAVGILYSQIKAEMESLNRPRGTPARRPPADYHLI